MKKYLALVLGVIFMLGFAASAFAIHAEIPAETQAVVAKGATQVTLGGELRFRGFYKHGTDLNQSTVLENADDSTSGYDGRVRLRIQADVSKNTQGVIHLEGGNGQTSDSWGWGANAGEAAGLYRQVGNTKTGDITILEAWILHKFNIGVPAGIKVGHMPLALGNGLFFNHTKFGDDAIVFFMDPTKELHIGLLTIKLSEGDTTITDDADAYAALFAYKTKGFNLSGDFTYVDDKRNSITTNGVAAAGNMAAGDMGTHLTNIGLRADVTFGNLNVMADAELQGGKTDWEAAGADVKHKGRAFVLGASYKAAPATIRAKYGYGSGDNNGSDDSNNVFITAVPNTQNLTYVYDYTVKSATGQTNTGIANTTFVNLGVTAALTKDLSGSVDYYVLRASKQRAGATALLSKKMGSELDAKFTYKLDKNLVYFVEGGYLWTGTGYDTATIVADDVYSVRHGITLSF